MIVSECLGVTMKDWVVEIIVMRRRWRNDGMPLIVTFRGYDEIVSAMWPIHLFK